MVTTGCAAAASGLGESRAAREGTLGESAHRAHVRDGPRHCHGFGISAPAAGNAAKGKTRLTFRSARGDYIGQGLTQAWTPATGSFTASHSAGLVTVSFNGGPASWDLDFKAPSGAELTPGPYEGATRYPFQSPATPGLDISGSGRGCNTLTGRFDVLEAVYGVDGSVQRFAADFEQHCEGGAPALRGSVRFNSSL